MTRTELLAVAKPIIFSTPMVQAIQHEENPKKQTRRVMKPQPCIYFKPEFAKQYAPYQSGTILWVRETTYLYGKWIKNGLTENGKQKYKFIWNGAKPVFYAADERPDVVCTKKDQVGYFKRPSIHMPRAVARIFLRVTDVRAERVQDITEADARAEGVITNDAVKVSSYIYWYQQLWDKLNAKRGYSWNTNPWVWVYEFERVVAD